MADVFNNEKRSEIMSKVRSKNNKSTELKLILIFEENSIKEWRRNYPVKGHPDFVFLIKRLLFLPAVAFGTNTIVGIPVLPIMPNIGVKNVNAILSTAKKLLSCLKNEDGQLFVFRNVN